MILDLFIICLAIFGIFDMANWETEYKGFKWFAIIMFVAFICVIVAYDAIQIYNQIMSAYVPGLK